MFIIIYPLTTRVVGAPQRISQPVSSIFPCSPLPSGTWRTQACPSFRDVVFPPLALSAFVAIEFYCKALKFKTHERLRINLNKKKNNNKKTATKQCENFGRNYNSLPKRQIDTRSVKTFSVPSFDKGNFYGNSAHVLLYLLKNIHSTNPPLLFC